MAKLKLQPDPTFTTNVEIPIAGGDPATVAFTFKHRTRDELQAFEAAHVGKAKSVAESADWVMEMVVGWDLTEPFSKENVTIMVQNHIMSPGAIHEKYLDELIKVRVKN